MNRYLKSIAALIATLGAWAASAAPIPFGTQQIISTGEGFGIDVIAGDLDGDGDLDLVGSGGTNAGSGVYWYENIDGKGTFSGARAIGAGQLVNRPSIQLVDMDGDGDLDLLSGDFSVCAWYPNDGQGNFGARTIVRNDWGFVGFRAADIDGDGDPDVVGVIGSGANKLAWFRNNGGGSFNPATENFIDSLPNGFGEGDVVAADIDGDGDLDLVALQSTDGDRVVWYENTDGAGAFSAKQTISLIPAELGGIAVADIDRDGDLDVVSVEYGFFTVRWHENTAGDGSAWADHTISSTNTTSFFVNVADMDLDGDIDVVLATRSTNQALWIENTAGDGSAWTVRVVTGSVAWPLATIAADIDGDGDPDIVTASLDDNKFAWNENRTIHRNATFGAPTAVDGAVNDARGVVAADVDGDGDLDAVLGARLDQQIVWFENDGGPPSGWTKRTISTPSSFPEDVAVADIDGDGDLDIASSPRNNAIDWLENDGAVPPGFTLRTITGTLGVGSGNDSVLGDIDGDGDIDLIALAGDLGWYENDGATPPGWTERLIDSSVDNPRTVELADIDGDGDLDVLTGTLLGTTLAWYENDGATPPSWTKRSIDSAGSILWAVAVDVDRDGDLDVAAASVDDDKIYWYENDGATPPTWTRHDVAVAVDVRSVAAVDLDFDGDIDFVSAPAAAGILWHENNGGSPLQWMTRTVLSTADSIFGFAAADLDGDGDPDLLATATFTDTLYALENGGGQYGFSGTDISTGAAYDGEVAPILAIGLQVHGRPGDSVGRLAALALRFETPTGLLDAPLSSAEANALFDELRIYRDDGSGQFEASQDILVSTVGTLSLTAGVQTVTLPASDPNMRVAAPATFFVTGLMSPVASQQPVVEFSVTHLVATSVVVDANAGLSLSGAAADDLTSNDLEARPRFVVDSTSDGVDVNPGDGTCLTGGGACTLRAAVMESNALAGADRIVLAAGTYSLTLGGAGEDLAAQGDLDITGSLTIVGAGASTTILDGGAVDRIFDVRSGGTLVLEDAQLRNGFTSGAGNPGGAIRVNAGGTLTVRRADLRDNQANVAGAIDNSGTTLVESSLIYRNVGFQSEAFQNSAGSATLRNTTISGNTGANATIGHFAGTLTVDGCTVSGNGAEGLENFGGAAFQVRNTVVALNALPIEGTFTSQGHNLIDDKGAATGFTDGVNNDKVGGGANPVLDAGLGVLGDYGGPTFTLPLGPTSPAVDAGSCGSLSADQRGVVRPIDVAGIANVGDACDMGAYELESGATLARIEVPVRWCGLRGAPSIEDPSLLGATNVNDLLRRRHEVLTENIYDPQAAVLFRSAANFIVEDFPLLPDPDCVEGPPGTFVCERGQRGDVYIDPAAAIFDEFEELIAACRQAWQDQDPEIQGVTAVQIRRFIDKNGTPIEILGIGGRAEEGDAREQAAAGRVAVVDHFYRQNVPGNPNPPNPSDTIDRLLGHEMGHALSLRHGDGLDNDGNSVIDDNDEAAVGLPRFDGDNLMQYRAGTKLTVGQAAQARAHLEATVPDVVVQPLVGSVTDGTPIDAKNVRVLEFGFDGVLDLANARVLEFRNASVLEFENESVVDFANARVLEFKNASVLEFKNVRVLEFGMGYTGEQPTDSTRLHATTAALPWPPALRPKTRYYFYLDVDRNDATGAYPASKANPSDPPHNFPGSSNFVNSPSVTVEVGVDLIAQVELDANCPADECTSTAVVTIFDYNDGTEQYEQVSSSPAPSITALGVGLYVDNGGAPVDLESAPSGITVQPEIPNSILFDAGWGFTTPGGGGPPVPDRVRMEVVTTIECAGHILNDDPSSGTRNCQCTSCALCPDYPGCTGSIGTPQTLADATILADAKSGELTFQPPVLPRCVVFPRLAEEGQAVTVYATDLPTDLSGTVVIERGDATIGSTPTASIDGTGSVGVLVTLPDGALGEVILKAGIAGYAPRAQCPVTVTPTVACPDNDGDGFCNAADSDDDNDGVPDGSDSAPFNPFVCRDLDGDTCDDCSSGVDSPANDGPDYDLDGLCDRGDPDDDNDGVLDGVDGEPRNANACGDSDGDQCDDCIIAATPSPASDGPDVDGDGLCDFGDPDDDNDGGLDWLDCAPLDATLIASPAEVTGVRLGSGGVKHRVTWTAPQLQGGTATVSDVVRGGIGSFPVGSGVETCLVDGIGAVSFDDGATPGAGEGFWYLIRARNSCGTGSYGEATGGDERLSTACP